MKVQGQGAGGGGGGRERGYYKNPGRVGIGENLLPDAFKVLCSRI